jgi:CheY-like chemotaxis protein
MSDKPQKVMLVDDDKFLLDMYSMKFSNSGYEVIACSGSEECLQKLKSEQTADIFVFDLIMPKMDGLALLQEVKKQNYLPNATKIILTNQGQASDIEKVEKVGVDGYIVKALHTPSEVVEKIKTIHAKK